MRKASLQVIFGKNQTTVTEFILLGFQGLQSFKIPVFLLLLIFHLVTLSGNLLIIWLVVSNKALHSPMYFFLTHLSLCDIFLTINIIPEALWIIWHGGGTMSFSRCFVQFYFFASLETSECLILSVMAYDRYLAICYPLRYNYLMSPVLRSRLVSISWLSSLFVVLTDTVSITQLHFCGPNTIDHFFCDLAPILDLSCSDTTFIEIEVLVLSILAVFPLFVIVVSYAYIVLAVLRISSKSGRWKTFSTCSSHLTVVSIFYGTLIGIYMLPAKGKSLNVSKVLSLMYTVLTPMMNPIIYSLRNNDIKEAIKNCVRRLKAIEPKFQPK
ncbi:olfactory receptor 11L1-like [Spea bombifrons]|uniref:olfactory receptor 11L1-like n=1 Tax=Spea bombifrons TaxID=233779 RepID=UPI00234BCD4C|nr:olfactory receptor 11L1-like [Spea bombifrons]